MPVNFLSMYTKTIMPLEYASNIVLKGLLAELSLGDTKTASILVEEIAQFFGRQKLKIFRHNQYFLYFQYQYLKYLLD